VITGSFNFTKAAEENNAENLLVIRDRKLADQYIRNWQEHERHSEVYGGRLLWQPPLDPKQVVSFEELPMSQVVQQEALIRLLVEKGIFTKEELLEMVKVVNREMR
jgi:phosphatidylserine/phosphatidylglycerophosphate/cardiolipin synthase-like enzyme